MTEFRSWSKLAFRASRAMIAPDGTAGIEAGRDINRTFSGSGSRRSWTW